MCHYILNRKVIVVRILYLEYIEIILEITWMGNNIDLFLQLLK